MNLGLQVTNQKQAKFEINRGVYNSSKWKHLNAHLHGSFSTTTTITTRQAEMWVRMAREEEVKSISSIALGTVAAMLVLRFVLLLLLHSSILKPDLYLALGKSQASVQFDSAPKSNAVQKLLKNWHQSKRNGKEHEMQRIRPPG